jgi:hypothetical protein
MWILSCFFFFLQQYGMTSMQGVKLAFRRLPEGQTRFPSVSPQQKNLQGVVGCLMPRAGELVSAEVPLLESV